MPQLPEGAEELPQGFTVPRSFRTEIGDIYGSWEVIDSIAARKKLKSSRTGKIKYVYFAVCKCACGRIEWVNTENLHRGLTCSCGCVPRSKSTSTCRTHGMRKTKIYAVWCSIKRRVLAESCYAYDDYGGRGIDIDPRWLKFENFYSDVGDSPFQGAELDRIDNNLGYWPNNVRWATRKEQMRNTRTNRRFEYNGESKTIGEWAETLGINPATLSSRIYLYRWSVEKALTTPVATKKREAEAEVAA